MTIEIITPTSDAEILRVLVDQRDAIQKLRISQGNRINAIMDGRDTTSEEVLSVAQRLYGRFQALELEIDGDIEHFGSRFDIIREMQKVKGLGPSLSAQIISQVDITLCSSVSVMWKWCGLGVTDGEADRRRKGEKVSYNPRLKTILLKKLGDSFLKSRSPYRDIYDHWIEVYTERNANEPDPEKRRTEAHIKNMARRKMVMRFVSHLWVVWREIEGLPVTKPYAHAILGHTHYEAPSQYGWSY